MVKIFLKFKQKNFSNSPVIVGKLMGREGSKHSKQLKSPLARTFLFLTTRLPRRDDALLHEIICRYSFFGICRHRQARFSL